MPADYMLPPVSSLMPMLRQPPRQRSDRRRFADDAVAFDAAFILMPAAALIAFDIYYAIRHATFDTPATLMPPYFTPMRHAFFTIFDIDDREIHCFITRPYYAAATLFAAATSHIRRSMMLRLLSLRRAAAMMPYQRYMSRVILRLRRFSPCRLMSRRLCLLRH